MNSHEVDSCWTPVGLVTTPPPTPAAVIPVLFEVPVVFGMELRKNGTRCGDTGGVEQQLLLDRTVPDAGLVIVGDVGYEEWLLFLSRNPRLVNPVCDSKLVRKLRRDIEVLLSTCCGLMNVE